MLEDAVETRTVYIEPRMIDADAEWRRVDIEAIWQDQLFPLLDQSTDLQESLERALLDYALDNLAQGVDHSWRYADTAAEPPFFMTRHDGAVNWLDDKIEDAAEQGDAHALAIGAIETLLFAADEADLRFSVETIDALGQELSRQTRMFWPDRARTASAIRPMGSCFWIAGFTLDLASSWRPDLEWQILEGDEHATVVAPEAHLIFDLLFLDPPTDKEPAADPLWFALGDLRSPTLRRVLDCRETNDRLARERAEQGSGNAPKIF